MNSDKLYKVQEQDLDRLKEILTVCFQNDPLYSTLIEDEATKERLLPHLLECDVTELFETCEVFADSPELKGVLILSTLSSEKITSTPLGPPSFMKPEDFMSSTSPLIRNFNITVSQK